jgi:hypothetical protein
MITRNTLSVLVTLSMGWLAGSALTACGPIQPLPPCTQGVDCIYQFKCNNNGNVYWDFVSGVETPISPSYLEVCAMVDPDEAGWQDEIRDRCTARCFYLDNDGINNLWFPEVCEDSNWSTVEVMASGLEYWRCPSETYLQGFDEVGDVLGSVAQLLAETLPCDLGDNCMDYLTEQARRGFSSSATPSIEMTADVQATTPSLASPGPRSSITLAGETELVAGAAAWSATACGYGACPFYLAQFDLTLAASLDFSLTYPSPMRKTLSDASVSLARATMGLWLPSTGDVIFPPGSLHLRLTGTVSGATNDLGENGNYDFVYPITSFVFGTLDSGELLLSHSAQDILGDWSLTARFN